MNPLLAWTIVAPVATLAALVQLAKLVAAIRGVS